MAKIVKKAYSQTKEPPNNKVRHNLDTLAQLVTFNPKLLKHNKLEEISKDQITLQKRARAKAFTQSYLFDLIDLKSPLHKSYWNTFHCSKTILQEGAKITAKYCNNRWCLTCNRIRTAKMINGYHSSIKDFDNPQFVTLTIPNVKAKDLKTSIEQMNKGLMNCRRNLKKTFKIDLKALRKYESTYNKRTNTYHPHFHLIVDGLDTSNELVNQWLKQFPTADIKAQDVRQANEDSLVELCKYFTKIIAKDNDYNPRALDIMFRAVKGKRTFQPIGIKKDVSEDIDEIQGQEIDFKPPQNQIWGYEKDVYDWVTADGELLSEYTPTKQDLKMIKQEYKLYNNGE